MIYGLKIPFKSKTKALMYLWEYGNIHVERQVNFNGHVMDKMSGQGENFSGWTNWAKFLSRDEKCRKLSKNVENSKKKVFDNQTH